MGKVSLTSSFVVDVAHKAGYDSHGPTLSQLVPLAAEATKLSIAVRDTSSGRTGSITIPMDKVVPAPEGR